MGEFDIDDIDFLLDVIDYLISTYHWGLDESWRKLKECGFVSRLVNNPQYVCHYDARYWGEYCRDNVLHS